MAMVANDPKAAKRVGIPQSVGQDYMKADKGRKFGSGSTKETINKQDTHHGALDLPVSMKGKGYKHGDLVKESKNMDKYALDRKMQQRRMADAAGRAMTGAMRGAPAAPPMAAAQAAPAGPGMAPGMKKGGMTGSYRKAADGVASKGKTKGTVIKMASGGSVGGSYRRAADGIASKGKTKGKMVKMNYGGKC